MTRSVIMLQIIHTVSRYRNKGVEQKIIYLLITVELCSKSGWCLMLNFFGKSKSFSLTLLEYFYPGLHVGISGKKGKKAS